MVVRERFNYLISCISCKLEFRGKMGLAIHMFHVHGIPGKRIRDRAANSEWRKNNREYIRAKSKRYYRENKERVIEKRIEGIDRLRNEVFTAYGNKCACCGETIRQ